MKKNHSQKQIVLLKKRKVIKKVHDVFIGLGSNLGHSEETLNKALNAIKILPQTNYVRCSGFYQTKAIGPGEQDDYLNAVCEISTSLGCHELLELLQEIEAANGRVRTERRWIARTLDLDILLYDADVMSDAKLTVPHARMHERAFVLYPLFEIAPELMIPGKGALKDWIDIVPYEDIEKI
jgi:2-amino-4-hydroxy-6-hydroxymethyldihydropteridine diphosphokinase